MKRRRPMRWLVAWVASGIVCLLFTFSTGSVNAGPVPIPKAGILILVYHPSFGPDQVAISYAEPLASGQLQRDLSALSAATGWNTSGAQITDTGPPLAGDHDKMVSVLITVPNAVALQSHTLSVAPFANVYKSYRHILLMYMLNRDFAFQGLHDYSDRHVVISLSQRGPIYTYQILVKDARFGTLTLPSYQLPQAQLQMVEATQAAHQRELRRRLPWLMGLVAFAALGTGGIVYYFLSRHA